MSKPYSHSLKHSARERFSWKDDAVLLGGATIGWTCNTSVPAKLSESLKSRFKEYMEIWKSKRAAMSILDGHADRKLSIADLDSGRVTVAFSEWRGIGLTELHVQGFHFDIKEAALLEAEREGSIVDPHPGLLARKEVPYILKQAIEQAYSEGDARFFIKLGKALSRKDRPPKKETTAKPISEVAAFIVRYWCCDPSSERNPYFFKMPPLCFFKNGALATFCAMALDKAQGDPDTSTDAVRKWVSRLGLKRVKQPIITDVKSAQDGIYFITCGAKV